MSVQLAPQHKVGLALRRRLLLANCTSELLALFDRDLLGAVVAPEVGARQRRPARFVERPGGLLLEEARGAFSLSGLRRLLRQAGDLPVLGRVLGAEPAAAARAAARLAGEGVAGIVADLLPGDLNLAADVITALGQATDLPLLAEVPLFQALPAARVAVEAGADALLVAGAPRGLAAFGGTHELTPVRVHGPLLFPLTLQALHDVAAVVAAPLVLRGGLLTAEDAAAALAHGAAAVAVDSLAGIDPAGVNAIGRALGAQERVRDSF